MELADKKCSDGVMVLGSGLAIQHCGACPRAAAAPHRLFLH